MRAAIDLGTVTSRLMVASVIEDKVEVLKQSIIITNIGEGLTSSGVISEAAYSRLLNALIQFRNDIEEVQAHTKITSQTQCIPVTAVATSAMRDAANAAEILERLRRQGFSIEVISGSREAELSFTGTLSGFEELDAIVMTIDVGGGSTELILGSNKAGILASHSFNIGSRRITELFFESDPPQTQEINRAAEWIEAQVKPFIASIPAPPLEVIAVAGTATSALTIRDGIDDYESSSVHGKRMSVGELDTIVDSLAKLAIEDRKRICGLHPNRAPVIIGGLLTLTIILKALGKESFLVSDTDILQGIILDGSAIC